MKKYLSAIIVILFVYMAAFAATIYDDAEWSLGGSLADCKDDVSFLNSIIKFANDTDITQGSYTHTYGGESIPVKARYTSESNTLFSETFTNRVEIWVNIDGGGKFDVFYNDEFTKGVILTYKIEDDGTNLVHTSYRVLRWDNTSTPTLWKYRIYPPDSPDEPNWYSAAMITTIDEQVYCYYIDFDTDSMTAGNDYITFAASVSNTTSPFNTTMVKGNTDTSTSLYTTYSNMGVLSDTSTQNFGFIADNKTTNDADALIGTTYPDDSKITDKASKFTDLETEAYKFINAGSTCASNKIYYNGSALWTFTDITAPF